MCQRVGSPHLAPGWVCCKCQIYNGGQRTECKQCSYVRCEASFAPIPVLAIPRERLEAIASDLTELLTIGSRLLPKIEAELATMSFPELVSCLNQIEISQEAAKQFQSLMVRVPGILGVDIGAIAELVVPAAQSIPDTDLPN